MKKDDPGSQRFRTRYVFRVLAARSRKLKENRGIEAGFVTQLLRLVYLLSMLTTARLANASSLQCMSSVLGPGYGTSSYLVFATAEADGCEQTVTDTDLGATASATVIQSRFSASASIVGFAFTTTGVWGGSDDEPSSGGSAGAEETFRISGNTNNIVIPLTFNFGYSGQATGLTTSGVPSEAQAIFAIDGFLNGLNSLNIGGEIDAFSGNGGPVTINTSGVFAGSAGSSDAGQVSESGVFSVGGSFSQSGTLELRFQSSAGAFDAGPVQTLFDFDGLLSVTVPEAFADAVDISQLSVSLRDGTELPVTVSTPEPSTGGTLILVLIAMSALGASRHRLVRMPRQRSPVEE